MRRSFLITLLAVSILGPGFSLSAEPLARFLTFTAKGKHGIFIRDLKREEVQLWLDGEPVEVAYLGYKDVETAYVILIENSGRTAQFNRSMPQMGRVNIVDRIRAGLVDSTLRSVTESGPALLAEFGDELHILQDFTRHDDELTWALHKMKPKPDFNPMLEIRVGKHLLWGVDRLRERQERRKILVLFTTTVDRESYSDLEEYRYLLRLNDIELYVVSFAASITNSMHTFEQRVNRSYFRKLTGETGGKLYLSGEHVFVHEFMEDLLTRLSLSYTIGFYVDPREEEEEYAVKLRVRDKKVKVDHRKKIIF